jgi:mono/diheme cytochrome c family protein
MRRKTKVVVVVLALAVFGGLFSAWLVLGRGFSAKDEPTFVEAFVARRVRSLATPRSERDAKNPVTSSPEVLAEAKAHFADHCATCHANDGSGDTPIGKGLYPKPPDMRAAGTQDLTDGELFFIIHNGIRLTGMPAFGQGAADTDIDSWKLVHFIRHLPGITSEELEQMKGMNPKSRHELEEEDAIRRFLAGEDVQPTQSNHKHE